jgi:glycogen debranching enzyme
MTTPALQPLAETPDRIRIGEHYYLLASTLAPRRPQLLLNYQDSFAIFDLAGDVPLTVDEPYGLFHCGTRFLHRFELRLNGGFPVLLSTTPTENGNALVTYLANADERHGDEVTLLRDTLAIQRCKTVLRHTLYERVRLHHYGQAPLQVRVTIFFGADFADIFELRGTARTQRGTSEPAVVGPDTVCLRYRGADNVVRETRCTFSPAPRSLSASSADFHLTITPGEEATIEISIACSVAAPRTSLPTFDAALAEVRRERSYWEEQFARLSSDNENFNAWLNRSLHDLAMLHTTSESGAYVYAGIPWFATVFGRDGLITALETLTFAPGVAAGVLRTLARLQGQHVNAERDEEPGKIVHELRSGEMAATGEIPFGRYYGSIDATPLFLLVFVEYADRTGDLRLIEELWPAAMAAMRWIDASTDEEGYLSYARRSPRGLINQGWKDSHDAIAHVDGTLAEAPIALAEVQAYVYAAKSGMARLARRLERFVEAATWEGQAARLREHFNRDFWIPEEGTFGLALDGDRRVCRVVSSNAGHCLFGAIADHDKAQATMARLLREDVWCGWGVRTLSMQARRYNPMSYHNGSVWPHDNALVAAGCARYGAAHHAAQILTALFDASQTLDGYRMPELFCGFPRQLHQHPVPYPVACKPQAWAAASVFLMLQATLNLTIDAWESRVTVNRACLPPWLKRIEMRGLSVGAARLDLSISRGRRSAAVEVLEKHGDVEVIVRK